MTPPTPEPLLSLAEIERLEEIARKATPGPWKWRGNWLDNEGARLLLWYTTNDDGVHAAPWDAAHIAAFDPPTVLRLLATAKAALSARDAEERT